MGFEKEMYISKSLFTFQKLNHKIPRRVFCCPNQEVVMDDDDIEDVIDELTNIQQFPFPDLSVREKGGGN